MPRGSNPIRVFLADEHGVIRAALRTILARVPGVEVVGEAARGEEAVDAIGSLQPSVAIVDLGSSELARRDTIRALREVSPETGVIVFTDRIHASLAVESIRSGARGYLSKSASAEEIIAAIRAVAAGGGVVSPEVAGKLLVRLHAKTAAPSETGPLSAREVEVLDLVSHGIPSHGIASRMQISAETVKSHLKNAYQKLGAADRAHAVALALRNGLLS